MRELIKRWAPILLLIATLSGQWLSALSVLLDTRERLVKLETLITMHMKIRDHVAQADKFTIGGTNNE